MNRNTMGFVLAAVSTMNLTACGDSDFDCRAALQDTDRTLPWEDSGGSGPDTSCESAATSAEAVKSAANDAGVTARDFYNAHLRKALSQAVSMRQFDSAEIDEIVERNQNGVVRAWTVHEYQVNRGELHMAVSLDESTPESDATSYTLDGANHAFGGYGLARGSVQLFLDSRGDSKHLASIRASVDPDPMYLFIEVDEDFDGVIDDQYRVLQTEYVHPLTAEDEIHQLSDLRQ